MKPIFHQLRGAFDHHLRIEGETVTIGGTTYRAVMGDRSSVKDLDPTGGGFLPDFDSVFFVSKSDFTTLPAAGDIVTDSESNQHRVIRTMSGGPQDPVLNLLCNGVNK